jgi:hypothetical protein
MITEDFLLECKDRVEEAADRLTSGDIQFLVSVLPEKRDELRYPAFLILQRRSAMHDDVYPYWNDFVEKLYSSNAYQRIIGVTLIGVNVKWDREDRFAGIAESYLACCDDGKPIVSRLTLQNMATWIANKPQYWNIVKKALFQIDINKQRDTMKKLILLDIIGVLAAMQKLGKSDDITEYLLNAMTGGILDKKSVKQIEQYL